ncbi:hypothetical protein FQZ97_1271810 [compost metagenome]
MASVFGHLEVLGPVQPHLLCRSRGLLLVQRITLGLVFAMGFEALVALPHLVVRDQRIDALLGQRLQVLCAVIARIGGDQGVWASQRFAGFDHGQQHGLFRT